MLNLDGGDDGQFFVGENAVTVGIAIVGKGFERDRRLGGVELLLLALGHTRRKQFATRRLCPGIVGQRALSVEEVCRNVCRLIREAERLRFGLWRVVDAENAATSLRPRRPLRCHS